MLAVPRSWDERRHPLPSLGRAHVRGPLFGLSVLSKVKPPTGEPCAGDPHARFGGEGVRPKSDFLTSIFRQKPENWCIAGAAHVGFAVSIRVRDNTPSSPSPS